PNLGTRRKQHIAAAFHLAASPTVLGRERSGRRPSGQSALCWGRFYLPQSYRITVVSVLPRHGSFFARVRREVRQARRFVPGIASPIFDGRLCRERKRQEKHSEKPPSFCVPTRWCGRAARYSNRSDLAKLYDKPLETIERERLAGYLEQTK